MEQKFLDFSLLGSKCYTERKFHRSESSFSGLFAPGNKSAVERNVQIPLRFGQIYSTPNFAVTPIFDGEYLSNGTRQKQIYNGR